MATHSLTFVIFAHCSLRERSVARPMSKASHESRVQSSGPSGGEPGPAHAAPIQPMLPKKEADMELYAAIDLHSNSSVLVVTDPEDHVVFAKRLRNDLELILAALRGCPGAIRAVAVESTYNWYWLVDGLKCAGFDVRLANTAMRSSPPGRLLPRLT
jgi:hypothetical protein